MESLFQDLLPGASTPMWVMQDPNRPQMIEMDRLNDFGGFTLGSSVLLLAHFGDKRLRRATAIGMPTVRF